MKLKKLLSLALVGAMTLGLVACGGKSDGGDKPGNTPGEKQDVTLRMWGAEEDQAMLQGMIDTFKEEYKDYANFTIELGVESEATAKDTILKDVTAGADVYAFASDQLGDLVKAGALLSIDSVDETLKAYAKKGAADIKSANGAGSVEVASQDGTLYAFPMTADNGYFLLYDKSVLSEDDVKTWDGMLAAAAKAGKKVGMVINSGWYHCGFFTATGFEMSKNADGTTHINWNDKADYTGVQVVQSMLAITSHDGFFAVNDGETGAATSNETLCALISGTWDVEGWKAKTGDDNFAAAKLPTFTIDGKQVQQGSIAGYKLVGVNPHSEYAGWAALLAEWITNEENQTIRFNTRGMGPANNNAAASDAVKADPAIAALAQQSAYGVPENVGGKFWDPTKAFGQNIVDGTVKADDTAAIQELLDNLVIGVTAPIE